MIQHFFINQVGPITKKFYYKSFIEAMLTTCNFCLFVKTHLGAVLRWRGRERSYFTLSRSE